MRRYVPSKGDLISLTFDPQAGHEQKGRRPALVISNDLFNKHTGMVLVCPVTSTIRGFPFHIAMPSGCSVSGVVMVEQVKSADYAARRAKFIEKAPAAFVTDVLDLLDVCIR